MTGPPDLAGFVTNSASPDQCPTGVLHAVFADGHLPTEQFWVENRIILPAAQASLTRQYGYTNYYFTPFTCKHT